MNSSRIWLDRELSAFAGKLREGALVLDAGAGNKIYARKFSRQTYESADFEQVDKKYGAETTYVCDLRQIPVPNSHYDAIVCTQVMEHLPEPLAVLQEFHRILKPGGIIFWSAPLWFEEHEQPYDFYRYTQFGMKYLFAASHLEILEMRWLDGYMGSVAHQFRLMKRNLPRSPRGYGGGPIGLLTFMAFMLLWPLLPVLRLAAAYADSKVRFTAKGLPINYLAILTKPKQKAIQGEESGR